MCLDFSFSLVSPVRLLSVRGATRSCFRSSCQPRIFVFVYYSLLKLTLMTKILYFTTENFTLLQETVLYNRKLYYMRSIFSTKLEPIKIQFSIRKLIIFFILILINVIEFE